MSSCVFSPISGSWAWASGPGVRLEEGAQERLCASKEGALWEENTFLLSGGWKGFSSPSQSTETCLPYGSNVMEKEGGACSYEPHGVGKGVVGWGAS